MVSIERNPTQPLASCAAPHSCAAPSSFRAWLYLIILSWQRQARFQLMLGIALGLLAFSVFLVGVTTIRNGWGLTYWPYPSRGAPTHDQWAVRFGALPGSAEQQAVLQGISAACRAAVREPHLVPFTRVVVFAVFLSFLLPILSLSFATEALASERERGSIVWLLSRPLPRSAIYLAKFVATLPWALGLNMGGFGLLCLAAGQPGRQALEMYWAAVAASTFAFVALFQLMGAYFRWPAVVAIVYTFFLEIILGNMPGYLKRVSISFYARCMMYDVAGSYKVQREDPSVFLPVDGTTAAIVLLGTTAFLLILGMFVFSRFEYRDAL